MEFHSIELNNNNSIKSIIETHQKFNLLLHLYSLGRYNKQKKKIVIYYCRFTFLLLSLPFNFAVVISQSGLIIIYSFCSWISALFCTVAIPFVNCLLKILLFFSLKRWNNSMCFHFGQLMMGYSSTSTSIHWICLSAS